MPTANPTYQNYLAVYGTLRRGGKLGKVLPDYGCEFVVQTSIGGRLYDLGSFPGYVATARERWRHESILCDIVKLPEEKEARVNLIATLDQIENYLYNRVIQQTRIIKGREPNGRYIVDTYTYYIYTARDWVIDGTEQITGNPADWLEWIKNKE